MKSIKIPGMNLEALVVFLDGVFSNISKFHQKPQKVRATLNHLSEEGSGQTAKEARKVAAKALLKFQGVIRELRKLIKLF